MQRLYPAFRAALFAFTFFASTLAAGSARASNKLWIAWDQDTQACKSQVLAFYDCILNHSNYAQMVASYAGSVEVAVGGSAVLPQSCDPSDFTCVVNGGKFAIQPNDVVMYFYGQQSSGGVNSQATVNGVPIEVASIQSGPDCDAQTCLGEHESYEAQTDGVSADCCNGQTAGDSCDQCNASCAQFQDTSGCYSMTCPNGTFSAQMLSKSNNEFDASGCLKLQVGATSSSSSSGAGGAGPASSSAAASSTASSAASAGAGGTSSAASTVTSGASSSHAASGASAGAGGGGGDGEHRGNAPPHGCGCGLVGEAGAPGRVAALLALAIAAAARRRRG